MTSGLNAFASIPISAPANPGGTSTVTFQINPDQFTVTQSRSIWLRIDDGDTGPALGVVTGTVRTARGLVTRAAPTIPLAGNQELVKVGYGTYTLTVGPIGLTAPSEPVEFSLAGDATGSFSVNTASLATIRAHLGQRAGSASFDPAADVNNNGVINQADLRLARMNLGAGTAVRPLGLTVSTQTTPVNSLLVDRTVTVQTNPGAQVSVGDTTTGTEASATADGNGSAQVNTADLTSSLDGFDAEIKVADTFGQYTQVVDAVPNALGEGYGYLADSEPPYDAKLAPPAAESNPPLPASVDLVTSGNVPPVYNQGKINSCTANAFAWDYWFVELKEKLPNVNVPSRAFIYYNSRVVMGENPVTDNGAYDGAVIQTLVNTGVAPESSWSYQEPVDAAPPPSAYAAAQSHKVLAYYQLNNEDLNQLKGSLAAGYPIVIGLDTYTSFDTAQTASTGKIPTPQFGERKTGGHAVVLVGYDDATQEFKFVNSWSTSWGAKDAEGDGTGYGYVPYSYVASTAASGLYSIREVS
ncbi:MAG: C1 family peptidase [Isosphaeraceae bacterium]|nr:C1 family peptidase [Isosphaeraceae bacterium]